MLEDDPLIGQLLLQVFLIGLNAVFACAEIAVISINDNKLERLATTGDKRAKRLLSLTKNPAKFLATIQVGITLAGFLGSAFAADHFSDKLIVWLVAIGVKTSPATLDAVAVVVITLILSYFTLILGELVPKRIAMRHAESLGLGMSGMIVFIAYLFAPLVWFLTVSTNTLLRLVGIDPHAQDKEVTEEEIRMMVDVGSEKGAIDVEEKEIIHNVFEFDNKTAAEVMTHRTDVLVLWLNESDADWETRIFESKHGHYPVCDGHPDNVVGVLSTREYFRLKDKSRNLILEKAVRPVQFVPETVPTDVLFRNMKKNRKHFAVVLDEYGGMSGVVTMNDLLEQLVGELEDDETAPLEPPPIEPIGPASWRIRGTAQLTNVEKATKVKLPTEKYDTFSGLVFGLLGSVPKDGTTLALEGFGLAIEIEEIREHRLERAIVTLIAKEADHE